MAKINETNYPRRQASEYAPTDMLIVQPVPDPEQEHSGDSRTTRVSDLKGYILGDADPSKIGTPAAGAYTSASNTNAQNIAALDHALANYDHLTKQVATQSEINGYISDPTTASFNVIYLLKDTSATGSDKYFEYQRLGTAESSTFEMTGDTSTDLSDYYTKSEVNTALGNKADKVSGAVSGNFAGLDANGNLIDSGNKASDFVASNGGESGDTIVTFTDPSADGAITSGSALKTIIGLIKYKFAHLISGHSIKNASGTAMTQRTNLQFSHGAVTDDSANDKTVVDMIGTYSEGSQVVSTANQAFNVVISATGLSTGSKVLSVCTSVKGLNYTDITLASGSCTIAFPGVSSAQTVTAGIVWR